MCLLLLFLCGDNVCFILSGCLTLAELGRRGLLLPDRLRDGELLLTCHCSVTLSLPSDKHCTRLMSYLPFWCGACMFKNGGGGRGCEGACRFCFSEVILLLIGDGILAVWWKDSQILVWPFSLSLFFPFFFCFANSDFGNCLCWQLYP